jgi:hypothetical protein
MKVRGGEFSTGTMGNFQPELTVTGIPFFGPEIGVSNSPLSRLRTAFHGLTVLSPV